MSVEGSYKGNDSHSPCHRQSLLPLWGGGGFAWAVTCGSRHPAMACRHRLIVARDSPHRTPPHPGYHRVAQPDIYISISRNGNIYTCAKQELSKYCYTNPSHSPIRSLPLIPYPSCNRNLLYRSPFLLSVIVFRQDASKKERKTEEKKV